MTRTIITPIIGPRVDPEGVSEQALPIARALAERTGARVVLVSVMSFMDEFSDLSESALDDGDVIDRRIVERRQHLAQRATESGLQDASVEVLRGDPADAIVSLAESHDDATIVIASHAHSGVKRMILGSVAFDIVERAACPVIVIPVREDGGSVRSVHQLERVLIPVTRGDEARSLVEITLATLGSAPLAIRLTHIAPSLSSRSLDEASEMAQTERDRAQEMFAAIERELREQGHDVSITVAFGSIERDAPQESDEFDADIIALSTHGKGGLGRLVLGAVAEDLATRVDRPLLTINRALLDAWRGAGDGSSEGRTPTSAVVARRARDIMTSPVVTVREDSTLEQVAEAMLEHRVSVIPVVDASGSLSGIITEDDFTGEERVPPFSVYRMPNLFGMWLARVDIERIYEAGRSMRAKEIMRSPVVTAAADEAVASIVTKMLRHSINGLPIIDGARLIGIVTRFDLLKMLAEEADVAP